MYQVTKEFEFCAAHRLIKHGGKCRHLHGHNYRAVVTFQKAKLDQNDMVVDFEEIKNKVGKWIKETWDHTTILNSDDKELINLLKRQGDYPFVCDSEPTAECLAKLLYEVCSVEVPFPRCVKVTIYETDTCYATYE